ncbi:BZ3500_MvSof-1268-A1-R1_Chr5-1g07586 [Microbotryum saponariae]|uniref:BZ3500_MvSof-1268-A1-R1_Chr5-1g07586 protein n=1 Tax=Microbotryum saponariae TaxID=289078 RepID=A0A2X0KGG7_9BASI|nr:BZ3500_MvSof-1268-A1-R1_Chr5-1g07586 [Microbotryum saponariae]SDA05457.1 BZ3501_MvSof-1269-A2-R1_Chr5-2g07410 [Microbotryum saponariae]
MFHIYLLVGCMTVGVICLVAYELDQQVQANQRRTEHEQRQQRMTHSYASPPTFKNVQDDEQVEGKSSAVEAGGYEKMMTRGSSSNTGLHERRRSYTAGAERNLAQEGSDHHQNLRSTLSSSTGSAWLSDSGTLSGSPPSFSAHRTSHSRPSHFLNPHHHLPESNTDSDRQIFTRHSRHNSFNDDDSDSSSSDSATEPLFEHHSPSRTGATSPDVDWERL